MSKSTSPALVPKLRFPEFRDARPWEEKTLGEVSNIVRGGSPRPIDNFLTNDDDGLNWLKIGDIDKDAKYITQTQEKIIPIALAKTREVNPGDLILSNSMSFGRPYILKIKSCIHDGWIAITEIAEHVDKNYLYYLISSTSSQSYFSNNAAGSGVKNLNADIIKLLPIFSTNLLEQEKIAACLGSLDELIGAEQEKLAALRQHKQGLMQQLFPAAGETIPRLRFPEFQGERPWAEKSLKEISDSIFDGTHQTPNYTDTGIPFYSVENIVSGAKNKFISYEDYLLATNKNRPAKNDILITRIGNIGFSQVVTWEYDFSIYVTIAVIKNSPQFNSHYLNFFMQSHRYQTELLKNSLLNAVPRKINMDSLRNTKVLLPRMEEQQKIADCLSALDEQINQQAQKIEALQQHKKGLMQQLFPTTHEHKEPHE